MEKLKLATPRETLRALISNAYLPRQIPPAITTRRFADFCRNHYKLLLSQTPTIIKRTTKYTTFTIPKEHNSRRHLALVHPLGQLGLSLLITKHRAAIRRLIRQSSTTLYSPEINLDRDRAFSGIIFNSIKGRKLSICSASPIILEADISRFFYTIYTHSLPWAIVGKAKVKNWLSNSATRARLRSHWSNAFDVSLQSCQSRETLGIPVGPDTSHLLAEVLLAAVEREKRLHTILLSSPSMRLVDDFTLGFNDIVDAERGLGALRDALWEYNLQLNDNKTRIIPSTDVYEDRHSLEAKLFRLSERSKNLQRRDIETLLDITLDQCKKTASTQPATAFCRRMQKLTHPQWNLALVLQSMFRLGRDYPASISYVAEFLINNRELVGSEGLDNYVGGWVRRVLKKHLGQYHDFEISWALIISGIFGIKLDSDDFPQRHNIGGVALAILGLLRERGLLSIPLSWWGWRKGFNPDDIYGENWLVFYESVRRGWTKDKRISAALKNDPRFALMLTDGVTFLNDKVFDARFVDLDKRTFRAAKNTRASLPSKGKNTNKSARILKIKRDLLFRLRPTPYEE